jgi:hypothetical protein
MPKLAEALVQRKQLQEKFQRLCGRIANNAKVQEGDQPDEQPEVLMSEAEQVLAEVKRLTIDINRTNSETPLPGSALTLMEAIAERDRLRSERQMLDTLGNAARFDQQRGYGATRNEVKWHATVNVADVQKQIDQVAQTYRQLDTQIQAANWTTDLIEK